jgi:hypothetical protein
MTQTLCQKSSEQVINGLNENSVVEPFGLGLQCL